MEQNSVTFQNDSFHKREHVNVEKLRKVIACTNPPVSDRESWKNDIINLRKILADLRNGVDSYSVQYKQQLTNFGRRYASRGIQHMPRHVRNYIAGEFYYDLDIKNCHPVIIPQLLCFEFPFNPEQNKRKIQIPVPKFAKEYMEDRDSAIATYGLEDKITYLKIVYNEILNLRFAKYPDIVEYHDMIYKSDGLLSRFRTVTNTDYKDYKNELTRISKALGKYASSNKTREGNFEASIFSHYVQNVENLLILHAENFLAQKYEIRTDVLMFDGLMIAKDTVRENLDTILALTNDYVFEKTGIRVEFVLKPTTTEWEPDTSSPDMGELPKNPCELKPCDIEYYNTYWTADLDERLFDEHGNLLRQGVVRKLNDENDDCMLLYGYLNQFFCIFDNLPGVCGFRRDRRQAYTISKVTDIMRTNNPSIMNEYFQSDYVKRYKEYTFRPTMFNTRGLVYNSYIPPPASISFDADIVKREKCPKWFEFIYRVIAGGNVSVARWINAWISVLMVKGKTSKSIVLTGAKGTGKTTFGDVVGDLVGRDYFLSLEDLQRIGSNFNSLFERKILTVIQEVDAGGGRDRVQNKIKSLITEETMPIERKGVDAFIAPSFNNFIFISNHSDPVDITEDNRRFLIVRVGCEKQNNFEFFNAMRGEVSSNIEDLRAYYLNLGNNCIDIIRNIPQTEFERRVREKGESSFAFWARNSLRDLVVHGGVKVDELYTRYKDTMNNQFKGSYLNFINFKANLRDIQNIVIVDNFVTWDDTIDISYEPAQMDDDIWNECF